MKININSSLMLFRFFQLIISLGILFTSCKKDSPLRDDGISEENLFRAFQIMQIAEDEFIKIGDSLTISPAEAMLLTIPILEELEDVEDVYFLDSTYLRITTSGGYLSVLNINEVDDNGISKYRGSGAASPVKLAAFPGDCKNKIENKKVLLFAAYHDDFYSGNEYQTWVVDRITNGDVDVEVTILKNEECTPEVVETFNQYGLVILDTHGELDGIMMGIKFQLIPTQIPGTVDAFLDMIRTKIGSRNLNLLLEKKLSLGETFNYNPNLQNIEIWNNYKQNLDKHFNLKLTSKGIREIVPNLSNTIVFANCCYSGFSATSYTRGEFYQEYDPVRLAWMSRNPISFYGYEAERSGVSYIAVNNFCIESAGVLIESLFHEGDSTGIAHLINGISVNEQYFQKGDGWNWNEGPLQFNHYGKDNWCYGKCGDNFTDPRDGKKYKTVCIDDQVWMADNLNYAGAGACYDNNPSFCEEYGRLYTFQELVGLDESPTDSTHVRGLCPPGWHVPSKEEYEKLFTFLGGNVEAGKKLRSTNGWTEPNNFTDEYGFNLMPAGHDPGNGTFRLMGRDAKLWTSTFAQAVNAHISTFLISGYTPSWGWRFSCRCLKD